MRPHVSWPPYHVSRGLAARTSPVTLFAGEAPHGISDHASRTASSLAGLWNSKHFPLYSHTMLVVGPEHARTFSADAVMPKFPSPEAIHVIVVGGTAGRFSMAIPGWPGTRHGSHPVTCAVEMG